MLVSVAVGLPRLPVLTYQASEPIQPGSRVLVPLGKRVITGVVVSENGQARDGIREVIEVLDDSPPLPASLLELTRRMADYYLCSWGEVLMAALPSGLAPGSVIRVELLRRYSDDELSAMARIAPRRAELLRVLHTHSGDLSVHYLQKVLKIQTIADQLDALHRADVIRLSTEIEGQTGPRLVRAVELAETFRSDEAEVANLFAELDRKAPKQSLALAHIYLMCMRGEGPVLFNTLQRELNVSSATVDALVDKGYVTSRMVHHVQDDVSKDSGLVSRDEQSLQLTAEQQTALSLVTFNTFQTLLLDGVTGSGKTLVYMRAMEQALRNQQTCLMLVPEISLTPQLYERYRAVFGNAVVLVHSRMSMGERIGAWQRIARGEVTIVLGPRSAVFAPLPRLGLIVVDEEHDASYKQDDPAPRYHGRDAAVMRASIEQCPVILGSATPSLESLHNVSLGRYQRAVLTQRTDAAVLPTIRLVSISEQRTTQKMVGTLSMTLIEEVSKRIDRNEGSILFLNRRGFSSQLVCTDCGTVASCPNCDVHLTWHKHPKGQLTCHYCGHSELVHHACFVCGGVELRDSGLGTQRVEEDLLEGLNLVSPATRKHKPVVARMDTDTMKGKHAHRKLLERFARGEVDVVIGTQMVAKGLDLPRVTLVGVVLADQTLNQQDFRAAERTAQLLLQVSGRSGRSADRPGEVIIQTYAPTHPVIEAVAQNTYAQWAHSELEQRREALYPPYSRFVRIELSGTNEADVVHVAQILDRLITTTDPAVVRYPPLTPSIAWIRNRHRRTIVIKNPKDVDASGAAMRALLQAVLTTYYEQYAVASVRVVVDVDAAGNE